MGVLNAFRHSFPLCKNIHCLCMFFDVLFTISLDRECYAYDFLVAVYTFK